MSSTGPGQSEDARPDPEDVPEVRENVHIGDNARRRTPLVHFEQVRGSGEAEVLRLGALQHGHVTRSQLLAAGLGRGAIEHRLKTGWLRQAFPSVFLIGGRSEGRVGRMMAAALHFRGDALITGFAAAELWQVLDTTQKQAEDAPVEVLLVGRNARSRAGITIHRVRELARQDIRWRGGIPLTSPARTILGLAAVMGEMDLEAVLSAAFRKNLVRRSNLADVMERNPGAKGIGKLRGLLQETESLRDTRSTYERKLLALIKAAELPLPITNVPMGGKIIDGLWPDLKLVYEFDGWLHHRDTFESDRLRDQHALMAGLRTVRITRRQIDFGCYALVARLASIITAVRLSQERSPSGQRPLAF